MLVGDDELGEDLLDLLSDNTDSGLLLCIVGRVLAPFPGDAAHLLELPGCLVRFVSHDSRLYKRGAAMGGGSSQDADGWLQRLERLERRGDRRDLLLEPLVRPAVAPV